MSIVLDIILPVFGVVLIGYLAARFGMFGRGAIEGLSVFVFNFAIPALLFRSLALTVLPPSIPWGYLVSYYSGVFAAFGIGIFLGRKIFAEPVAALGVFALGGGFSNTVLLGIPLILTAFGERASVPLFMIITFHSFLLIPAVTTILESGRGRDGAVRRLWWQTLKALVRNPVIVALLSGVAVNRLGIAVPKAVDSITALLGSAAAPGALFAMGASLSQYRIAGNLSQALALSGVKLAIHPLLVWILAALVFDLEPLWTSVAVVMAAMPSGVMMYVFAQRYRVAIATATTTVLVCTALSTITLSGLLLLLDTN